MSLLDCVLLLEDVRIMPSNGSSVLNVTPHAKTFGAQMDFGTIRALLEENRMLRDSLELETKKYEEAVEKLKADTKVYFELSHIFKNKPEIVKQYYTLFDIVSGNTGEVSMTETTESIPKTPLLDDELTRLQEEENSLLATVHELKSQKASVLLVEQKMRAEQSDAKRELSRYQSRYNRLKARKDQLASEERELGYLLDYWKQKSNSFSAVSIPE